ncbi:MAG: phosphate ABC transporter substrate-binding protein [Hydrococcus sp. RU_2_2]|nr:phosphate ABC transporter substrate-binding protein [Hydrococcus sp. RU_2_2]NJP20063.1 phosphate ABC transporter substrate-binding protein [Hydrococcus sp. CRU_1_1]
MAQKNETAILILSLLVTAGILGGGYWWFSRQSNLNANNQSPTPNETLSSSESLPPPTSLPDAPKFDEPKTVPSGTTVRIDGSTSMGLINQALKKSFESQFPGTSVVTDADGSENGIKDLLAGNVDIAAISRPLNSQEKEQGLIAIPVAKDAIAIVVGNNNPFRRGLTKNDVVGIFEGKITDWSAVGGRPGTIRVINRPPASGTRQTFQELFLEGKKFGSTPNITEMQRDATTPILQALGKDGIGYATYAQVADQQTVTTLAVDGTTPEAGHYPYQRQLYYVYKTPPNPSVQVFLGYAISPPGQDAIAK